MRKWPEHPDTGGLDDLRYLPRTCRSPKVPRNTMARLIERSVQPRYAPKELQRTIREEAGTGWVV